MGNPTVAIPVYIADVQIGGEVFSWIEICAEKLCRNLFAGIL